MSVSFVLEYSGRLSEGVLSFPATDALVLLVPVFLLALNAAVGRIPTTVVHRLLLTVVTLQQMGRHCNVGQHKENTYVLMSV